MEPTYTAENLSAFIERIKEIKARWDPKEHDAGLWFRGSQKSHWPLIPGLYRYLDHETKVHEAEDEIREEFIKRAPSLTEHRPVNGWEWYFMMQHYGVPTRLLDWTENPQLGLYFAVKDSDGLHDAAVWILNPWWLNGRVLRRREVLPPGSPGLIEEDSNIYNQWLPDRFDRRHRLHKQLPVAVFANHFERSISAQSSCFTIHGLDRRALDKLFPSHSDRITRVIIPSFATEAIREELNEFGIDEVTVYPDLQGLGIAVRKNWLPEDLDEPYNELYTRLQPSQISGVGVFAIRKIKKGTHLFTHDLDEMRWVKIEDIPKQQHFRRFYDDFGVWKDGWCGIPKHFHRLTMSWYLNDPSTGEKPNVICDQYYDFWASRDINPGEELTVDSRSYSAHAKPTNPNATRTGRK
jgi:FRG domain